MPVVADRYILRQWLVPFTSFVAIVVSVLLLSRMLRVLGDVVDKDVAGFRDSICDEAGMIRVYVNVFVNGENVGRDRDALSFKLGESDEGYILASVAGGTR